MPKEIRLNAFHMNAPGHSWAGLWAHPRDASVRHDTPEYWTHVARTAERGKLDAVFLADVIGVYDVYGNSPDTAIRTGAQAPTLDPFPLVPLMAAVMENLSFGVTATLTYENPYMLARRFSTLDHLTRGRIAWNIVTGILDSDAKAAGLGRLGGHDTRYERAEEFLGVVYDLWEGSWADDALVRDRGTRVYTRPDRVRRVSHHGAHYDLDAIHLVHPSPQRTPFLFQAGASAAGRAFAGGHAEAVFVNGHTKPLVAETVRDIRRNAVARGRRPDDVRIFLGTIIVVAPADAEARDREADYRRWHDDEGALALLSGWSGVDLSRYGPDEPIEHVEICPSNVFDTHPEGPPDIARPDDCQTCFHCELYCQADALYVAPDCDQLVEVDAEAVLAGDTMGQYRRHSGWHEWADAYPNEQWLMETVFRRAAEAARRD